MPAGPSSASSMPSMKAELPATLQAGRVLWSARQVLLPARDVRDASFRATIAGKLILFIA
jgi:hypothetical protein